MNKKTILPAALVAALVILGGTSIAEAKTNVEKVKGPCGQEKEKVLLEGEVTQTMVENKNKIILKEKDGKEYAINIGPKWYKDVSLNEGEKVKVEAVENKSGQYMAWKVTRENGEEIALKDKIGKSNWANGKDKSKQYGQNRQK